MLKPTETESTGIKILDKALGGGLPVPSGIVLMGPLGSGKTALGRQLVANLLDKGYAVMYVTVDEEAESSKSALEDLGVDVARCTESGQLYFFDVFKIGVERLGNVLTSGQEASAAMSGLPFLELLRGELLEIVRRFGLKNLGRKQFGLMDSMTPLFLTASETEVYQFSQTFKYAVRFLNGIGIGTLHEHVLDEKIQNVFLGFADGIIKMSRKNEVTGKKVEGGGYLKVVRMKDQNFFSQQFYYSLEGSRILLSDFPSTV